MANSIYNSLQRIPANNNMIQQFNQFRNALQGDPKQIVQGLLNSGRMTQQQYNQLSQMAGQFRDMLRSR